MTTNTRLGFIASRAPDLARAPYDSPYQSMTQIQSPSTSRTASLAPVMWLTLAAMAHLALVSAAIETFSSRSPVRWWVVGTIVTYLAGLAATWRAAPRVWGRMTASGIAMSGAGLLLGLLALTVWLPEGTTSGIRLFGQSTGTVLAGVSGAAVTLAGVSLARLRALPAWARYGLAALAAYGVVAFALGINDSAPYSALFQSGAFWVRLPHWLQGAFIGMVFLVPLAMVEEIIVLVRRRAAGIPWASHVHRTVALGMSVLMAMPAITLQNAQHQAPAGESAVPPEPPTPLPTGKLVTPLIESRKEFGPVVHGPTDQLTVRERVDRLDTTFDTISEVLGRLPRDSFDPGAVVASAGREPERLLQWIRSRTAFVPYRGVLRGAVGVLMDRVGNSLDIALLLAELLRLAGHEVRLARADLSAQQVENVLRRVRQSTTSPTSQGPRTNDRTDSVAVDVLRDYADKVGGKPEAVREAVTKVQQDAARVRAEVIRRSETQANALRMLAGEDLARVPDNWAALDKDAIADHWWVQVHDSEAWTDLDPMADAWRGATPPTAQATLLPSEIEPGMYQQVHVTVGIECACGQGLEERPVFDQIFRVSDVSGTSIMFKQVPAHQPPSELMNATSTDSAVKWLASQEEWISALAVGAAPLEIATVSTKGVVVNPQTQSFASPVGGFLDAFGGDEPSEPSSGYLTAQFIDYEVLIPGQQPRKERRYVVDWLGAASRAARSQAAPPDKWSSRRPELVTQVEILILGAQPSRDFVAYRVGRAALAEREAVMRFVRQFEDAAAPAIQDDGSPVDPVPLALYELAAARRILSSRSEDVYFAEPNILSRHEGLTVAGDGAALAFGAFDIVANAVRARARAGDDAVMTSLHQGVVDAHAELLLASSEAPATNIAELSLDHADQWRKQYSGDTHLMISPVQARSTEFGVWRIDLSRGSVLALTPNGWGGAQATVELGFQNAQTAARTMKFIAKMFAAIVCAAIIAAKAIKVLQQERYRNDRTDDMQLAAALAILGCAVAGITSAVGGVLTGSGAAAGQMMGFLADMYSLGGALVALYYVVADLFGGVTFTSKK